MIFSIPLLILAGPCLLMCMGALSLFVVHRRLSRVPHALIWSWACLASAAQWAIMAGQGLFAARGLHGGLIADLCGLAAVLLVVEGLRARRGGAGTMAITPSVGALAVLLLILPPSIVPHALRPAIAPLISIGLLVWGATLVTPGRRSAASAEIAVVAVLLALALIHLGAAGAAVAEWRGLLPNHRLYAAIYTVTAEPAVAAVALVALLSIAFDFSVEAQRLIHTDPLTGVLNREGFNHLTAPLFERPRPRVLSLAVADIDGFKQVNDRFGHAVGDATLVAFAAHLAGALGRDGRVARVGGEEFALLLPGVRGPAALDRIEALRRSMDDLRVPARPDMELRASFGVAERHVGESPEQLFARADEALYRSKRDGRNRSTLAERTP